MQGLGYNKHMRIVFFGTSEFAIPALEALKKAGMAPAIVVTSPDRPAGRGMELKASPVKEFIKNDWLTILQPEKIDDDLTKKILEIRPEVGVVAAYGKILPKSLIDVFPKGILNIHPSLLPKYRGSSPLEYTILAGEEFNTGVTVISIDEQMDHGPIVAQRRLPAPLLGKKGSGVVYSQLHNALAKLGAELLVEILPRWIEGNIEAEPQDHDKATYTKLIKKEDGEADWNLQAEQIERMTRAYEKWPGTYAKIPLGSLASKSLLKIIKAEVIERHLLLEPGKIFEKDGFPCVACGERALKLLTIQPEGKNEMGGDAYLRGHREIIEKS